MIWWMLGVAVAAEPAATDPLLLDAGNLIDAPLIGFSRLSLDGSDDTRVSWSTPPMRVKSDRGPDPLSMDHVVGGVLQLNLEPGEWAGWAMLGSESQTYASEAGAEFGLVGGTDEVLLVERAKGEAFFLTDDYTRNPFPVFRPEQTSWHRQVAHRHPWREFSVMVPKGGLQLQAFGKPLQALVLVPRNRAMEGELLVEVADAERQEHFHTHIRPSATQWTLPDVSGEGPLTVHVADWRAFPDKAAAVERPEPLRFEVAPSERFGRILWLFPGDGDAEWRVDGLEDFQVRGSQVHWLDASFNSRRDERPRPAFMRPSQGRLEGDQGVPVGVALEFEVPPDARGEHSGRIWLKRGDELVSVTVEIRIRKLALAAPAADVGFYYDAHPAVAHATGDLSVFHRLVVRQDFALMHRYGMRAVAMRFATPFPKRFAEIEEDTEVFEELARLWRASGGGHVLWLDPFFLMRAPAFGALDADPLAPEVMERLGFALRAAERVGDAGLLISDEGARKHVAFPDRAVVALTAAREMGHDVKLYGTMPHAIDQEVMGPHVDGAMIFRLPDQDPQWGQRLREKGASPWAYNLTPGRSGPGLVTWEMEVDGLMQWHFNDTYGDPFDDTHMRRQFVYALLGPAGEVWPTPILVSFGEGVIDQRYLVTLEALVGAFEAHPSPRRQAMATRGRALLESARESVRTGDVLGRHDGEAFSEASLDRLRGALGDEAEKLYRQAPGPVRRALISSASGFDTQ